MTWEKGEELPPDVIHEFEHGNEMIVMDNIASKMGQTMHTLVVGQKHAQLPSRQTRPVIQGNTG